MLATVSISNRHRFLTETETEGKKKEERKNEGKRKEKERQKKEERRKERGKKTEGTRNTNSCLGALGITLYTWWWRRWK